MSEFIKKIEKKYLSIAIGSNFDFFLKGLSTLLDNFLKKFLLLVLNQIWQFLKWLAVLTLLVIIIYAIADSLVNPYLNLGDKLVLEMPQSLPESGEAQVEIIKNRPEVRFKKWNGEVNMGLSYLGVNATGTRAFMTDRVEWKNSKEEVHAYPLEKGGWLEDGGFEVEIILNKKPEKNTLDFQIDGYENLEFGKQLPLWQQVGLPGPVPDCTDTYCDGSYLGEGFGGSQLPENMVNSYAVYHMTKRDYREGGINYATGKAFHIARIKAIDADGAWVWGDMNYEQGILKVIVPQEFLDTAEYPVIVDPSIGYVVAGSSSTFIADDQIQQHHGYSFYGSGNLTTMSLYAVESLSTNFLLGIYDDDDSTLIAATAEGTVPTSAAWTTLSFSDSPAITAGPVILSWYYEDGTSVQTFHDNNFSTNFSIGVENRTYDGTMPSTITEGIPGTTGTRWSVYFTFTGGDIDQSEWPIYNLMHSTDNNHNHGSPTLVWTSDSDGFAFFLNSSSAITMASTSDGGSTWGNFRTVDSVNTTDAHKAAVWYDRWTPGDTTGNKIHIATFDSGVDDTYYTEYDTVTDTLSTTVITGTESANLGFSTHTSITKAENGALYVVMVETSDNWVHTCSSSCTNGANWSAITAPYGATEDGSFYSILLPVAGGNNVMLINWDINNNDIESNIYSATSSSWWGWNTGINQDEEEQSTYQSALIGATLNRSTGEIYLIYGGDVNDYSIQDHDLEVWEFDNTTFAWTQKTNVVTNVSGGLISAKIAVDENTGNLYAIYGRRTTIGTNTTGNIYSATSTDNGTTWSSENGPYNATADDLYGININIMSDERIGALFKYQNAPRTDDLYYRTIINLTPAAGGATTGQPRVLRFGTLILLFGTFIIH